MADHRSLSWLPFGPLEEFVAGRGGIAAVLGVDRETSTVHGHLPYRERKRIMRGWNRAARAGRVTDTWADDLCMNVLGINPALIWGEEWWALDSEVA